MTRYVGILDGVGRVWGVRVPDVPGCTGGGKSPEEATDSATVGLREVAAHLSSIGVPLRKPRTVKAIMDDPEAEYSAKAGETFVMIPLISDKGRSVRANLSLDAGLLEAIDEEAKRRGLTRSAFIASAAMEKIAEQR